MGISSALGSSALLPAGLGFRNLIINGGFDIWQRGTSQSSGGYGSADRWLLQVDGSGATRSMSQQSFTPGNPIPGYEPTFFLRYNQSVAGSGATYNILDQRIEDVRELAGQQVSVSFWAKADSARTLTTQIQQAFGTGGSSEVQAISTQTHSVTTSWQRFTYTATMASISGKTIGTNSYIAFRFNFPNNATFTFDIWGVQVEGNYQPTPFEQRPIGVELALCQRYYYSSYSDGVAINGADTISGHHQAIGVDTASAVLQNGTFAVPMRSTPTVNFYQPRGGVGSGSMRNHSAGGTDVTGVSVVGVNNRGLGYVSKVGSLSLGTFYGMEITANAEL